MNRRLPVFALALTALTRGAESEPWKDKDTAQWTKEDAKRVITDSPWAKTVLPEMVRSANNGSRPGRISVGLPGIGGIGRQGGGGYPQGGNRRPSDDSSAPMLNVRWESALPIKDAESRAHTSGNPEVDEDHYAIAVYGLPGRMANGDTKTLAGTLKKQAVLKREGKKDLKPSSVEVLRGEDGPVILYQFPRSAEIVKGDRRIEFDAQIQQLKFEQAFYLEDMIYRGKLEL